jgi:hypothetical protein
LYCRCYFDYAVLINVSFDLDLDIVDTFSIALLFCCRTIFCVVGLLRCFRFIILIVLLLLFLIFLIDDVANRYAVDVAFEYDDIIDVAYDFALVDAFDIDGIVIIVFLLLLFLDLR